LWSLTRGAGSPRPTSEDWAPPRTLAGAAGRGLQTGELAAWVDVVRNGRVERPESRIADPSEEEDAILAPHDPENPKSGSVDVLEVLIENLPQDDIGRRQLEWLQKRLDELAKHQVRTEQ
jgi:hypothetical protein